MIPEYLISNTERKQLRICVGRQTESFFRCVPVKIVTGKDPCLPQTHRHCQTCIAIFSTGQIVDKIATISVSSSNTEHPL